MMSARTARRVVKTTVFVAATIPLALLVVRGVAGELGANPIESVTHQTGIWALRLLFVTLAISPLRRLSGWHSIMSVRRMLGLLAFFYATLHFGTYLMLDQFFDLGSIVEDVVRRPYLSVGLGAFTLLVPLAVTSTKAMIRRLGGKRWLQLHRLIYLSAVAAVVHYLWLVKADTRSPLIYGTILAALLGYRAWQVLYTAPKRMSKLVPQENRVPAAGAEAET